MPYLNGAEAAVETLRVYGVNTVFGPPGNHTLPFYDAV